MKQYIQLIIFVGILGVVTSLAFASMDILFSARIEANENAALYQAVLSHNDATFTSTTMFDVFNSEIVVEDFVVDGQDVRLYLDSRTNNISFVFGIFNEGGYIDDIVGILTIEDDFITIVDITILQQAETPGLGGKVALREFLDQFMGLQFDNSSEFPIVIGPIGAASNAANEVDQIAGATNTSDAFQRILIESYSVYKDLWESIGQ